MSSIRKAHPGTIAAVKSGVVASLIETLTEMDSDLKKNLPPGSYGVRLSAPGGIGSFVSFKDGSKGMHLRFLSCEGMSETLSGGKALLIPIPTGGAFLKGLKAFQRCVQAVSQAMTVVPEDSDTPGIQKKTRLLLTAALRGVCEIYNYDHWIRLKSASIPEGNIAVLVTGSAELSGTVTQKNKTMTFKRGADPARANAILEFSDVSVCYGVLTGQLAAMGELGSGRVMIKGKISMIQGLFPLLDRFGELMK
ncbi:hypothetical protein [Oceanispirochaeta sp.]|jgi:hypothetical protein|uniref:hypothetical protein n=1 Tax=Oceanispirochaeta sp. TaxID=2035350 RepID=UPI00262B5D86|nr:hypothetical protein [Oceanispirochaeta sp.]MDA3957018.1 hypothetical protein [Oceanispirochaeta sp.]